MLDDLLFKDDAEALGFTSVPTLSFEVSFSRLSLAAAVGVELPKSRDVPGVLGVFPEDPNEAKAPEPRPKAEEAPLVGEATLVVKGAIPLNGLDLLLNDPSPPNRFAGWYGREDSDLFISLFEFDVERESLLELLHRLRNYVIALDCGAHLDRRCHKLSMSTLQQSDNRV